MLALYLIAVNILSFILFGVDKSKARRGSWRVSEKTLFAVAAIGGSIGAILGMFLFRHKTKHFSFRLGLPLILVGQLLLVWFLFRQMGV